MGEKRGLFVVFEGIDGAGTSTQLPLLTAHIKELSKYHDVLETHEPWRSEEIKKELEEGRDVFSDGERMARLYVDDRTFHSNKLIEPNIYQGVFVLSDRYKMSTCAYQWAQGVDLDKLLRMHEGRGLITPDLTFFVDVFKDVAESRLRRRGSPKEKFEGNSAFTDKLISCYRHIFGLVQSDERLFGKVFLIDGNRSVDMVSDNVRDIFDNYYSLWHKRVE